VTVALTEPKPQGDHVELLDGGREAFPRMLAAIGAARHYIHLEIYTFEDDAIGERFLHALQAALERGVKVSVTMDGIGSAVSGRTIAVELRARGAEVRIYNRLLSLLIGRFRRNHRKLLLVDDEVAYLGGINIGEEYAAPEKDGGWADLAVEVRGPACANLGRRVRRERHQGDQGPVKIFLSGLSGSQRLRRRYIKALGIAEREVYLAHGYFLPDRAMIRSITAAARRGVEVHLLLAGFSDVPFTRTATLSLYTRLLKAGVHIYEWTTSVLHAKAAVIDGERLLIGSFNLDPLSLSNLEALVEAREPQVAEAGRRWIATHVAHSLAVSPDRMRRTWLQRWVIDRAGLLFARVAQWIGHLMRRG
jgi:cardiolipin synthase